MLYGGLAGARTTESLTVAGAGAPAWHATSLLLQPRLTGHVILCAPRLISNARVQCVCRALYNRELLQLHEDVFQQVDRDCVSSVRVCFGHQFFLGSLVLER